jgi:hypothetical protein
MSHTRSLHLTNRLTFEAMQKTVYRAFNSVLVEQTNQEPTSPSLDLPLLESGLDSLGFAILVARLEDELGYDPFSTAEQAYYPHTFLEFIHFYVANQP